MGQYPILIFGIGVVCFISFIVFGYFSYYKEYLKYNISGRISSFHISVQGLPTVKVKENSYHFNYNWNRTIQLEVGDSLYKSAGDYEMWLRIANRYQVYIISEQLMHYRIHAGQGSAGGAHAPH